MTITLIELPPDEAEFLAKLIASAALGDADTLGDTWEDPDALLRVYDRIGWHVTMIRGLRDGGRIPADVAAKVARQAKPDIDGTLEYELAAQERARTGDPRHLVPGRGVDETVANIQAEIDRYRERSRLVQAVIDRTEGEG